MRACRRKAIRIVATPGSRIGCLLAFAVFWMGLDAVEDAQHAVAGGVTGSYFADLALWAVLCMCSWWLLKILLDEFPSWH